MGPSTEPRGQIRNGFGVSNGTGIYSLGAQRQLEFQLAIHVLEHEANPENKPPVPSRKGGRFSYPPPTIRMQPKAKNLGQIRRSHKGVDQDANEHNAVSLPRSDRRIGVRIPYYSHLCYYPFSGAPGS